MKGQISRLSYRPERRYSGVYHAQGAMITDADLDERSEIVKARTDALGDDTVKDGCPAVGGAVDLSGAAPMLREGVIYADGVRGLLRFDGDGAPADLAEAIARQADFPDGPPLPSGPRIVYADIWERAVFPLEDPYLADPGLHGAETGFRTQTMCQIKTAAEEDLDDVLNGTGRYPLIGDATLAVTERTPESTVDECDPCADVVPAELRVANTLFRLEVVRVRRRADGTPDTVDLAWSAENAAAIAPSDVDSDEFEIAGGVYERFSPVTERHMGALSDLGAFEDSVFVDDLDAGGDAGMPFVRRWDGWARINFGTSAVQTLGAGFSISLDGSVVTLVVDVFEARLTLAGRAVLKGDHWLVETRTYAEPGARIRLVDETPVGIRHHHCLLLRSSGGVAQEPTDAERRLLTFPALSDLPADHVSIANNCPKLYGEAKNVQEALDNLCAIEAEDIAFDNNCPRLYDAATNLQEALDNLCKVDFSIETTLRLLMDWGVVCGLKARPLGRQGLLRLDPGWFLDRSGKLASFDGADVKIDELIDALPEEDRNRIVEQLLRGSACLTVALGSDGVARPHLISRQDAAGLHEPGMMQTVHDCIRSRKGVDPRELLERFGARERRIIGKFMMVAGEGSFKGAQKLERNEEPVARAFTDLAISSFEETADEEEKSVLKQRIDRIDQEFAATEAVDETLAIRRAGYFADRFSAVIETEAERRKRCICNGLFPDCPPDPGRAPHHVPVACIGAERAEQGLSVIEVCMYCCRKQALTWRSMNYYLAHCRAVAAGNLEKVCCSDHTDHALLTDEFNIANLMQHSGLMDCLFRREGLVAKPDVTGLATMKAVDAITGHGGELVDTVEVTDEQAFERLAEKAGGDPLVLLDRRREFQPGDKVALLTQGGQARGYVVLERGGGKFLFTPESERKAAPVAAPVAEPGARPGTEPGPREPLAGLDPERVRKLAELAERLTVVEGAEPRIETELEDLGRLRDSLLQDVERLKAETAELEETRSNVSREVTAAETQVRNLVEAQRGAVEGVERMREELAAIENRKDEIIREMRESQPVANLNLDRRTLTALNTRGIVTVGDARREADRAGLTDRQRDNLISSIESFVNPRRR